MILKEARRLYNLGFAVHWIKPNSKVPVKSGWNGVTRDNWKTVKGDYQEGVGLGVRMGEASLLASGGYLANIDVDIKSDSDAHRKEAMAALEKAFPGLYGTTPVVKTGYGLRLFIATKEPVTSQKIMRSDDECVVFMPTSEINRRQLRAVTDGMLSQKKLDKGWRVRPAWEIELMSIGKQVVLPPSIHPETLKPYRWQKGSESKPIPIIDMKVLKFEKKDAGRPLGSTAIKKFEPVLVDLIGSSLPDGIVNMILDGKEVEDRSAACFSVSLSMVKHGFTDQEIMSVLTDKSTFLGETSFDHRKTKSRSAAAAWVRDYCLRKAREELDAARAFSSEVGEPPLLQTDEAVKAQTKKLITDVKIEKDWQFYITRSGKDGDGPPKGTVRNVILIVENCISPVIYKRDLFSNRELYGCNTPWGGKKNGVLEDIDAIHLKVWLSEKHHFEPTVKIIEEAIIKIASKNSYHPIREALLAGPEWDGRIRLDHWLRKHFQAQGEKEYLAQVFRKLMVGSVTRIFEPGAKFDWMPIFEGGQGIGKSIFGAILFGQKNFRDWLPDLSDKDAALGLQGALCVEFGELDRLRRSALETTKAFITRQVDVVRPPFGRRSVEIPRQCIFYGSTNSQFYLKDDTGNRRFNPVMVGQLDIQRLKKDRDQLWAEALFIYQNYLEPRLYLDGDAESQARHIQSEKMVITEAFLMQEKLEEFIEDEMKKEWDAQFDFNKFKLASLFGVMGPLQKWKDDATNMIFAAKAVCKLGGKKRKIRGNFYWAIDVSQKIKKD